GATGLPNPLARCGLARLWIRPALLGTLLRAFVKNWSRMPYGKGSGEMSVGFIEHVRRVTGRMGFGGALVAGVALAALATGGVALTNDSAGLRKGSGPRKNPVWPHPG